MKKKCIIKRKFIDFQFINNLFNNCRDTSSQKVNKALSAATYTHMMTDKIKYFKLFKEIPMT